jgi:hypothetical protein
MHPPMLSQRQVQQFSWKHIPPRHVRGEGGRVKSEILGKLHGHPLVILV